MRTARIWARKVVERIQHEKYGSDSFRYMETVQANEAPRRIITRGNAAAFVLKQETNR